MFYVTKTVNGTIFGLVGVSKSGEITLRNHTREEWLEFTTLTNAATMAQVVGEMDRSHAYVVRDVEDKLKVARS